MLWPAAADAALNHAAARAGAFALGRSGTRQRKSSRKKVRCTEGHSCKADPQPQHVCDVCKRKGTYARCSGGCDYDICASCFEAKGGVVSKQVRYTFSAPVLRPPWPPNLGNNRETLAPAARADKLSLVHHHARCHSTGGAVARVRN
jgi:hypothetical protein